MSQQDTNLMRSSLELLILKALTWRPQHGYAIAEWIDQVTEGALLVEEGTLYPALHRMERKEWIESKWGVSSNNRRAKYYDLTEAGRSKLHDRSASWLRHVAAVSRALEAQPGVS